MNKVCNTNTDKTSNLFQQSILKVFS